MKERYHLNRVWSLLWATIPCHTCSRPPRVIRGPCCGDCPFMHEVIFLGTSIGNLSTKDNDSKKVYFKIAIIRWIRNLLKYCFKYRPQEIWPKDLNLLSSNMAYKNVSLIRMKETIIMMIIMSTPKTQVYKKPVNNNWVIFTETSKRNPTCTFNVVSLNLKSVQMAKRKSQWALEDWQHGLKDIGK